MTPDERLRLERVPRYDTPEALAARLAHIDNAAAQALRRAELEAALEAEPDA